jgi:hypothetical protein
MSELSTASDRVNSSQPSGSDSCGENLMPHDGGGQVSSGEDPSHSDGHWPRSASHQPSDSDGTMTPRSHDTVGTNPAGEERGAAKDPRDALWENIKSEMARVELSRDRMTRRLDITQSPGSTGAMANFREKMGMNESGPVIPFGHGHGTGRGHGVNFSPPYRTSQGSPGMRKPGTRGQGGTGSNSGTPGSGTADKDKA